MSKKEGSCIERFQSLIVGRTCRRDSPKKMWYEVVRKDLQTLGLIEGTIGVQDFWQLTVLEKT